MTLSERIAERCIPWWTGKLNTKDVCGYIWQRIMIEHDSLGRPITGKKRIVVWDATVRHLRRMGVIT